MRKLFLMAIGFAALASIVFYPTSDTFAKAEVVRTIEPGIWDFKIKDDVIFGCQVQEVFTTADTILLLGNGFVPSVGTGGGATVFLASWADIYVISAADFGSLATGHRYDTDPATGLPRNLDVSTAFTDLESTVFPPGRPPFPSGPDRMFVTDEGWIDCLPVPETVGSLMPPGGPYPFTNTNIISGPLPSGNYVIIADTAPPNLNDCFTDEEGNTICGTVTPDGVYNPADDVSATLVIQ